MRLVCIGSSSKGNCYLLEASQGGEVLMMECGMPMREVKRALGWSLRRIAGCIVTHSHGDHAGQLRDVLGCGIRVLALPDVLEGYRGRFPSLCKEIMAGRGYKVGGFRILPLPVAHDVPCVAYVVEHDEMGRLLFVTDTMMIEFRIKGIDHLMIECNYSDDILKGNIESGEISPAMASRLMGSHMELATTREAVREADREGMKDIMLIHLSGRNSDAGRFAGEIRRVSGLPVYVARPGLEVELQGSEPY